jgi:hypothetical protein
MTALLKGCHKVVKTSAIERENTGDATETLPAMKKSRLKTRSALIKCSGAPQVVVQWCAPFRAHHHHLHQCTEVHSAPIKCTTKPARKERVSPPPVVKKCQTSYFHHCLMCSPADTPLVAETLTRHTLQENRVSTHVHLNNLHFLRV